MGSGRRSWEKVLGVGEEVGFLYNVLFIFSQVRTAWPFHLLGHNVAYVSKGFNEAHFRA